MPIPGDLRMRGRVVDVVCHIKTIELAFANIGAQMVWVWEPKARQTFRSNQN